MAILASIVLGFSVAIIGAWKDTAWEKFSWKTFFRSPLLTIFWGIFLQQIFPDNPLLLIALSAVALERLTVESWKGIFRKMPSKFASENRDTQWLRNRLKKK